MKSEVWNWNWNVMSGLYQSKVVVDFCVSLNRLHALLQSSDGNFSLHFCIYTQQQRWQDNGYQVSPALQLGQGS